jgi:hypothetical protein
MRGNMFVASHGSWNREIGQVGTRDRRLKMGANGPTERRRFSARRTRRQLVQGSWTSGRSRSASTRPACWSSRTTLRRVYKIGYKP